MYLFPYCVYCAYDLALPMHAEQMSQTKTAEQFNNMLDDEESSDVEELEGSSDYIKRIH